MKHVTYASKSVLMGDVVADLLLEYAGLLPGIREGDTVTVNGVGPDGNEVEITFVLNGGTQLVAETAGAGLNPPTNSVAEEYLRGRVDAIRNPPRVVAEPESPSPVQPGEDY